MKPNMKKILIVPFVSIFTITASGCATPIKRHPEFAERHKRIRSISVMPPEITAYKLTFQGERVPLHELIPIMEEVTVSELKTQFAKKGYEVKELVLSKEVLESNSDLRTALFNLRKIFNKTLEDIQKGRKTKFTYTLGSDVNMFADIADCDVLVFVVEEGLKKSAGEIVKDVAQGALLSATALLVGVIYVPIPRTAATIIHVAIVDANDGAILCYTNNKMSPDIDPENKRQLRSAVRSQVTGFPKIASPKAK